MKLSTRKREGEKVFKTHDMNMPLNSVLESPIVDEATNEKSLATRNFTDIVWLSGEIEQASERLSRV